MDNTNSPQDIKKDQIGKYFFRITVCIEIILLVFLAIVIFFHNSFGVKLNLYSVMAISIIILWIAVLIAYYAWAIYFYNINLGLTDSDWEKIEVSRTTDSPMADREDNPNALESLGLPPGTVRGTIALTMLVGALAMTLVLFGEGNRIKDNEIFVDNFDFFKTAFLMMTAFYFGQKSLEYLLPKKDAPQTTPTKTDADPAKPAIPIGATTTAKTDSKTEFDGNGAQG
ncbi:MAG: hypothetical protein EHM93_02320 [Bacteroidales bacterium]|nr:MAG: hypothetical protein EHM93_02320 [Bacteroidales bacterium]